MLQLCGCYMSYMTQNFIKRGHTWSARYIVPTEFRQIVGKREIVRSLKTRDLDEARKLRHSALDRIVKDIDQQVYPEKSLLEEAATLELEIEH